MSIYYSKLDPISTLSKLTYKITLNNGELSTINKNQRDVDILNKSSIDSEELRKKIQIENEEVYGINIIITLYSRELKKLNKFISMYRAKLYSKGIGAQITNFRHLDFYLSNLPLGIKNVFIQNNLIITTKALANIFPLFTENILDLKGIQFGITNLNKRVCMIDMFSNKYENNNMCIFGTSGSGKSYFTKLCILRNYFQGKKQIVLDIENEYSKLCKNLNGSNFTINSYFNIFQITKADIKEKDFLENKVNRIVAFLMDMLDIKLENSTLKNEIISLYKAFNITKEVESVLKKDSEIVSIDSDELIERDKFPTLYDLRNMTKYKTLKKVLDETLNLDLKPFSSVSSIDVESKLFVLNMNQFKNNEMVLKYIFEYINRQISYEEKTIIYIDELFKYFRYEKILEIVNDMYKSIRKKNAGIVTITQDITDFSKYKDGYYLNSILNNSSFKMIFKTEYEDSEIFNKVINTSRENIVMLKKGEAYLVINRNNVKIHVVANDFERVILNENDYSN